MDLPLEDQRAPNFPAFTLALFEDLKQIFKTESGQIFIFSRLGHRRLGGGDHQYPFAGRCGAGLPQ